jgi:plastocyanin
MIARSIIPTLCAAALLVTVPGAVQAQDVNTTITIRNHHFEPAELKVPANKRIVLKVVNEDPTPEEFESKEFKAEKVIAGKSQGIVRIAPLKPGRYKFYGEYHEDTAKGVLVAE